MAVTSTTNAAGPGRHIGPRSHSGTSFTDTDGTQPDCWRYIVEVQDANLPPDDRGYR